MADQVFNIAKQGLLDGTIDLDTDTIKMMICMTNTNASGAAGRDIDTLSGLTLDEYDGTGYTGGYGGAGRKTISGIVSAVDDTADDANIDDPSNYTWSTLGAGTRSAAGFLLFKQGAADDTTAIPIAWFDGAFTGNGGDVTIQFNAEGILVLS